MAKCAAVLMMLQGHAFDVLLAPELRGGAIFRAWTTARGFTSCMFLLASGFAFAIATRRQWHEHAGSPSVVGRRLRRFATLLVIGYALHFPAANLAHLPGLSEEAWRGFLAVDVLQCTAVTLCALQLLVVLTRTPARHAAGAAVACVAVVLATPLMWQRGAGEGTLLAAYMFPGFGSLFPLFPWAAYILSGAVLGHLYISWGESHLPAFANGLLCGGAVLLAAAVTWPSSHSQVMSRTGVVLLVLGAAAHISRHVTRDWPLVRTIAKESLLIYVVHLAIVYGSAWNIGFRQIVGSTLHFASALAYVAGLCAAMTLLAYGWQRCKQGYPAAAQWIRVAAAGLLMGKIF
jgi:hypothetical protein